MENKTKIILTAIGLSAVVVPAIFLFFLSSSKPAIQDASVGGSGRQIDKANIEREVNSSKPVQPAASPNPSPLPSPTPSASPGVKPAESTPSSQ